MQKKMQYPLSPLNPVAFGWTKRPIKLSGELHPTVSLGEREFETVASSQRDADTDDTG